MRNILDFLINASKLKEMPRTGWVLRGVKNPETVADHTFVLAFAAWLFSEEKNLRVGRAVKVALAHDLCEVYAGDITPNFYYPRLPKSASKRKKMLAKWTRLSKAEKGKIAKAKFKKEKSSLFRLTKDLSQGARNEIIFSWLSYEKGIPREAKLVDQLNRIETLIQSIQYFGTKSVKEAPTWWEWVEEVTDDPLLLEFLETVQKRFYRGKIKTQKFLQHTLNFILELGKLKRMPRLYWQLRKVKDIETVAGHIYILALAAWVLGTGRKEFNTEKLIKMALCHELSAIFTGDTTPYDRILTGDKKQKEQILKRIFRLSRKEKESIFLKDYREEKKSLEKLALKLNPGPKKEMLQLWHEYRTRSSPEGNFLSQLNVAVVLLQGLLYEKKYRNFSASPLWEWSFEVSDHPLILEFLEAMKQKFYE